MDIRSYPCPDCPDVSHKKSKKLDISHTETLYILALVVTHFQKKTRAADIDWAVFSLFENDDIKDVQTRDPYLSQFMEIFFVHTVKPHTRELAGKSSEVRILCAL